jgi:hypothetical protein
MAITQQPWILAPKGGPSGLHLGIVNGQGRVVAAMIPNEDDARLFLTAPALLECAMGAEAFMSWLSEQGALPAFRVGDGEDMTMQLLRDIRAAIRAVERE